MRRSPSAPVDSTAARSRSTTASGGRERDAGGVVRRVPLAHGPSLRPTMLRPDTSGRSAERAPAVPFDALAAQLGRPCGPRGRTHVSPTSTSRPVGVEDRRERLRLARRIVRLQVQLREAAARRPARGARRSTRAADGARAGSRRSWRRTCAARRAPARAARSARRAPDGQLELVLVEHEPEVVDARRWPLTRLDDDVHRPFSSSVSRSLNPSRRARARRPGLVGGELLPDAAVARNQVECELADVPRFDLADAAGDEVIVEELHRRSGANVGPPGGSTSVVDRSNGHLAARRRAGWRCAE